MCMQMQIYDLIICLFTIIFCIFEASMWFLVVTTTGRFREVTFYWNWTLHRRYTFDDAVEALYASIVEYGNPDNP